MHPRLHSLRRHHGVEYDNESIAVPFGGHASTQVVYFRLAVCGEPIVLDIIRNANNDGGRVTVKAHTESLADRVFVSEKLLGQPTAENDLVHVALAILLGERTPSGDWNLECAEVVGCDCASHAGFVASGRDRRLAFDFQTGEPKSTLPTTGRNGIGNCHGAGSGKA